MSNVPADKREFHLADSGVELKSDDTQFDVVTWRESIEALLTEIAGDTGGDASTATISRVALNASTSTILKTASTDFVGFFVSNSTTENIWLKFQAAATDNDKKGIYLKSKAFYEMPTGQRYTGEISAIADSGTPTVDVIYY
jgi:hypothetical protein